jgi:hypothetical protein
LLLDLDADGTCLHLDLARRLPTLLQLLLLHVTAVARRSAASCPAVCAAACPAVIVAALFACTKRQQHWELAKTVLFVT